MPTAGVGVAGSPEITWRRSPCPRLMCWISRCPALPEIRPPGPEYDPFDDLLVTSDVHAGVVVRSAVDRAWDERHCSGLAGVADGQVEPASVTAENLLLDGEAVAI
jgi:hypothetical protein